MKKALSLFLAVLMMFSVLGIGASAASDLPTGYFGEENSSAPASLDQVVIQYNLNGGSLKYSAVVRDETTGQFYMAAGASITGTYIQFPVNAACQIDRTIMKPGMYVATPEVVAPSGSTFMGWTISYEDANGVVHNTSCAGGESWMIPADAKTPQIVKATAKIVAAEAEEDTLTKVMGIMIKIFGAIIGIIMYQGDTAAGVELMEKVIGGLF